MNRRRVLIVDDNPSNLKLLEFLLSGPSYDIKTATSGQEALALLDSFDAELLLLDLQLPDLDGLSLLKRVRHNEHTRHLPVIAVTAYAMLGDEERARAAGVDDYLTKPIDKQLFRKKVAEHLKKRGKT